MAPEAVEKLRKALARTGRPSSDFDLNPNVKHSSGRVLRDAGVLVPITLAYDQPRVILTKRSSALKHHPGQIAFPGGKVDAVDSSVTAAALREANEEIGLPLNAAEVLGHLPDHETVTGFRVTPVVAIIHHEFEIVREAGEVEEVFLPPLSHLTDALNFSVQARFWRGEKRHYFTVPWGPYYIWGATARMLKNLTDHMKATQ